MRSLLTKLGRAARAVPAEAPAEALAAAAVSVLVSTALIVAGMAGPDTAAHVYQRAFFLQHGFTLWNNLWYAGRYQFITYSPLYYPVAAVAGIGLLAALSAGLASFGFTSVLGHRWGRVARWSSWSFALIWPAGVVITGVLPFALGMALGLVALAALQRGTYRWFAACAVLALASSVLAFVLLGMAMVGAAAARRSDWRRLAWPILVVLGALGLELAVWALFRTGGRYPFGKDDFVNSCIFAAAGALLAWKIDALRGMRWLFVVYGAACAMAFVLPSELGANIARVRLVAIPIGLLLVSLRRWRPLPVCLLALGATVWWTLTSLTGAYARAAGDSSSSSSFWDPAVEYLRAHLSPDYRVEVVDTSGHWPAVYFPQAGIPVVRGWFRQDDFPQNEVLYAPLSPERYLSWLHTLAVRYVVLSDAPPDYSSQREAALLRSGQSGLPVVLQTPHLTVYEVPDPESMVSGPGSPHVTRLEPARMTVLVPGPGTFRVAIHWSPYWTTSLGCLMPGTDGTMVLRAWRQGTADIYFRFNPARAVADLAGVGARCDAP
ncbi:MAG TPA: hypothetical protein VKI64_08210, partial [Acidimicrobiales bacterium]|nr:hypothetical protein [Acidimicrobiales bacterium]